MGYYKAYTMRVWSLGFRVYQGYYKAYYNKGLVLMLVFSV